MAELETATDSTESRAVEVDEITKLRQEFEEEKRHWEDERRKLNKLTTEAQQDAAEATRFIKKVLPTVNKVIEKKGFVERWEESPEKAVQAEVETTVTPLAANQRQLEHRLARIALMQRYPDFATYEPEIARLSQQDEQTAEWSWSEKGLERLYKLAKSEDLEKKLRASETKGEEETQKVKASTEGSSAGGEVTTKRKGLTPEERRMAKTLGFTEEDYLKYSKFGATEEE